MHDELFMYRVQWPILCQHLHRLCLGGHKTALLDMLCNCGGPCAGQRVKNAVDTWRQAILDELAQKTHTPDAWPGWEALIPLFGHTERLYRQISTVADKICHEHASGGTGVLWNVLHAYFIDWRDDLDSAKKTRLQVWRRLDRIRHDVNKQRRHQGLSDCYHLPALVAHVLAVIESQGWPDAPTTVEGVWSYFVEFDPTYAQAYDEEIHGLEGVQELTDRDLQLDLARCLELLPVA